jgi:hypothetical protein
MIAHCSVIVGSTVHGTTGFNWTIIVVLIALSLLLAAQVMLPKLFA